MDWSVSASSVTAIYAAIVATAALALEIRRWFESGPRLVLTLMPEAKAFGGAVPDENTYLHARVTNRGTMPTTITHYGLHEYRTVLHKLMRKASRSAVVNMPVNGPPLPYVIQPGTEWSGSVSYNNELRMWAETGKLFVAIYHSHSARPVQLKVKLATGVNEA